MVKWNSYEKFLFPSLLIVATSLFLLTIGYQINLLINKTYIINKRDLIRLDSIKNLSSASYINPKDNSGFEFQDETYKTFIIDDAPYSAIINKNALWDSLKNCDLIMTIFTDSTDASNYFNQNNSEKIKVIGLNINDKPYIDLNEINPNKHSGIVRIICFLIVLCLGFLIIYIRRNKIQWKS